MTKTRESALIEVLKLAVKLCKDDNNILAFAFKMIEKPANDAKY
jgi:hypothetical protein